MTIWDTIFKAVFVVAVPITLAVYACVYVGERAEHDVARPRPPRRRPPGALTQREDLFLGIWKTAPGFEYPRCRFPFIIHII